MKNMRNKIFSIAIGALACAFVALPAVAQGGGGSGSDLGGIFQGFFQEIASWFDLTADETELGGATMPGGQALTEEPEVGPFTMPGGLWAPGDSTNVAPYVMPGGRAFTSDSPEMSPIIFPGG